jgi:hypothetical protein
MLDLGRRRARGIHREAGRRGGEREEERGIHREAGRRDRFIVRSCSGAGCTRVGVMCRGCLPLMSI